MNLDLNFLLKTFVKALSGIPVTVGITIVALIFGFIIALLIFFLKEHKVPFFSQLSSVYLSFVRSTPIILQILIFYSIIPSILNQLVLSLNIPFDVFSVNPIFYAFIVFSINASANLTEIICSSLRSVNKGQLEAVYSVGMTTFQGYIRIIIPQALVSALPNLCNLCIALIKSSSLVFLMSVKDVTGIAKIEASYRYNYIEAYMDIFLVYLLICFIVQIIFRVIEKQLSKHKKVLLQN